MSERITYQNILPPSQADGFLTLDRSGKQVPHIPTITDSLARFIFVILLLALASSVFAQPTPQFLDLPNPDDGYMWVMKKTPWGYIPEMEPIPRGFWEANKEWITWVVPLVLSILGGSGILAKRKGYVGIERNGGKGFKVNVGREQNGH